jgi:hypothetical protein
MMMDFLNDKFHSSKYARTLMETLRNEGLSMEEMFAYINKLTPEYEEELFGSYTGRIDGVRGILKEALAEIIDWEKLSPEESLRIVILSQTQSTETYHDGTLCKAIKAGKISFNYMNVMIYSENLNNYCNRSLCLMIQTGKLNSEQVLQAVKDSSYHFSVAKKAIETNLFSIDKMLEIWQEAYHDYGVAYAIAKTGLASDENLETMSCQDSGFLEQLRKQSVTK